MSCRTCGKEEQEAGSASAKATLRTRRGTCTVPSGALCPEWVVNARQAPEVAQLQTLRPGDSP